MFHKFKESLNKVVEKITTTELKEKKLDEVLWDLQLILIQNDVAVETAEAICEGVKNELLGEKTRRFSNPLPMVQAALRVQIKQILEIGGSFDFMTALVKKQESGEPFIVVFVGINGTGKTTSIAKITKFLLDQKKSVVIAAGDTYRAGSVEQIEEHAKRLGVRVIKHQYGSDSAAVVFDAIQHARARKISTVLVDTAGRMQTNKNLMNEMKKIVRINNPDAVFFVGDALAGNDALSQAKEFNEAVKITGSILTKVDADAKGGAALSIIHATKKPIVFVGIGQSYSDLQLFNEEWFLQNILPE
ncbi:MAG: signal recognition particle-docking protein FtsY [Candidatus Ranarchaeia archaeon]